MKTLRDLFLNELADVYDAERRTVKALPKLAKLATCKRLKAVFEAHLTDSRDHVAKLEQVFAAMDVKPRGKTCRATVGLLEEADEAADEFKGSPALNAALVASAQKLEHYEIATYGCLHEWAELLGNRKSATLLKGILDNEKRTNEALNALAHGSLNEEALGTAELEADRIPTAVPVKLAALKRPVMAAANPPRRGLATKKAQGTAQPWII